MWKTASWSNTSRRRGIAGAWVVVALLTLLGVSALVIDIGRLVLAAQRAQDVADTAALAGGRRLPYMDEVHPLVFGIVGANNTEGIGPDTQCDSSDLTIYGPGDEVPDYGTLGNWAYAMRVTTRVPVEYGFARIVGIEGSTAFRSATVLRAPVGGLPICTMWIAHDTPLNYGQEQQLLMADGPHYAEIPGSFGFVQPPTGCTAAFFDLLQGYNVSFEDIESSFAELGDSLYAETGLMVGQWMMALEKDQGRARLERGSSGKWANDTFETYYDDNPRIMLIPMVRYLGGTGSNAEFEIVKFGAFWLEEVNQGQKEIWGRFIQYQFPGGDPDGTAVTSSGIFGVELIK